MLTASHLPQVVKVLIVDDDPTVRLLAKSSLEKIGLKVAEATSGHEGLAVFKEFKPDLVLLDVLIPSLDGFATCIALRQLPWGEHVPIIMMTGLDDIVSINRAYEAGATDFITKPINWSLLGHRLRYVLRASQALLHRRQLENQLYQSQKMEAVGRLAGGMAHDFNNLLTVISGCCNFLGGLVPADHPWQQEVEEISHAAEQAASLTRQLLAFSRKQVLQPENFDLNVIVAGMDRMLRRVIGEDIEFVTLLGEGPHPVKADPGQIEQVIMNLAINARDAMPRGGRLVIETAKTYLDTTYCNFHMGVKPGPHVMLAISDTGIGMDPETKARIFDPFFTTKEMDRGTGLGLATVDGIINQSGGMIWVYSEPGQGSTFKVYLPEAPGQPLIRGVDKASLANLHGKETILLVEDDEPVRRVGRRILEKFSYKVLEAAAGKAALELGQEYPGPIHLLFTDVIMPGMSGKELADAWHRWHPETLILYTSGYTENVIVHQGTLDRDTHFIQKPYRPELLIRKIREILDCPARYPQPRHWGDQDDASSPPGVSGEAPERELGQPGGSFAVAPHQNHGQHQARHTVGHQDAKGDEGAEVPDGGAQEVVGVGKGQKAHDDL
jgi:signal transduction histidine kinase